MDSLPRKRKGARSLAGSLHDASADRKCTCRHRNPRPNIKKPPSASSSAASPARRGVVMTAPPASGRPHAAPDSPCRGLKRKVGCIDSATRIGRKKRLEAEYELGTQIGRGKFGAVRICARGGGGEAFACKALPRSGGETGAHREVEIMQHLSGHPGVVTLRAVFVGLVSS
ncbi:serine/threonine-protein kinase PEPKR2-like [Lolium perenne]|uniref:serine/threonine-protein kinase PEPKR2-like n=1 Tax=Lolium perenne TaxID=4522 RepID=UPI003A992599